MTTSAESSPSLVAASSGEVIAILVPTLQGGGAERVASRLSLQFATTHRVLVVTWDGRFPAYEFGGQLIDLMHPSSSTMLGKVLRVWRRHLALAKVLEENRVTHAIALMESVGIPLAMVKRRFSLPLRATVSVRNAPDRVPFLMRKIAGWWYRSADRIVIQTQDGLRRLCSQWALPEARCEVIPNPVPTEWLTEVVSFARRQIGLVVAAGRLEPQKDFTMLLQAMSRIPPSVPWCLVILGEGSQRAALQILAAKLGILERVQFPGYVQDVRDWLDRARVFVLSSRHEGFPNALAEAMARACPVVSTDCPTGPGEMIEHGQSGWLVPVGDVVALANAMTEALLDHRRAELFGLAARQRAEEWAIDRIAPRWLEGV
jgi:GalNAc-alpha-(1->4)-GalNAc-alpha-(1->3)-diNAcBac-PP-undecaprenol alpha-1,4-N-acetyl-D-galactosaminyltransferase